MTAAQEIKKLLNSLAGAGPVKKHETLQDYGDRIEKHAENLAARQEKPVAPVELGGPAFDEIELRDEIDKWVALYNEERNQRIQLERSLDYIRHHIDRTLADITESDSDD